jgi:hypothetical protein
MTKVEEDMKKYWKDTRETIDNYSMTELINETIDANIRANEGPCMVVPEYLYCQMLKEELKRRVDEQEDKLEIAVEMLIINSELPPKYTAMSNRANRSPIREFVRTRIDKALEEQINATNEGRFMEQNVFILSEDEEKENV